MISLQDACYYYHESSGKKPAINSVTMDIHPKDYRVIIGANGSGKSTLAKLLNCLLLPTSGEVRIDGLNTKDARFKWDIRSKVGMVFQNPENQLLASTVEEEVAFGPENLGLDHQQMRTRIGEALDIVGLSECRCKPPYQLSGGQKQRLAIAAVLAMYPEYLVLDEATSMLDAVGRKEILQTISHLNQRHGMTIIHITHDMAEATLAKTVSILHKGQIVLTGTPKEIFSKEKAWLENLGLDLPTSSRIAGELIKKGMPLKKGIIQKEELVNDLCRFNSRM